MNDTAAVVAGSSVTTPVLTNDSGTPATTYPVTITTAGDDRPGGDVHGHAGGDPVTPWRRRPGASRQGADDAGMSLVELLVAMSVFAVLLAVVMTSVVATGRSAVRAQNTADTADDARRAFTIMDKQARYADAVNFPGAAGGDYWVELRTISLTDETPRCVQWRYRTSTGELQTRTWTEGAAPSTGAWTTVLTTGARGAQGQPFGMVPTSSDRTLQSLTVSLLDSRSGAGSSSLQTTFVARNSSAASPGNTDVAPADGVSDTPVCAPVGYRS